MEFLRTFIIAAITIGVSAVLFFAWFMAIYMLKDQHPGLSLGLFFGGSVLGAAFVIASIK